MRPVCRTQRQTGMASPVDERLHAADVVDLTRNENLKIVREAYETAIEHPVRCTREGDAVMEDVRAVMLYRLDMGGGDLRPSSAIDNLQTGKCTPLVIGAKYELAENAIA